MCRERIYFVSDSNYIRFLFQQKNSKFFDLKRYKTIFTRKNYGLVLCFQKKVVYSCEVISDFLRKDQK
jgi:hypothetical protein